MFRVLCCTDATVKGYTCAQFDLFCPAEYTQMWCLLLVSVAGGRSLSALVTPDIYNFLKHLG